MERRNCPRYPVSVGIEVTEIDSQTFFRGNTTDVSLSGCYVATIFPLPIGTMVDLKMRIKDSSIEGHGSVKTCHPGVGMGIKFIDFTREAIGRLDDFLHAAVLASDEEAHLSFIQ